MQAYRLLLALIPSAIFFSPPPAQAQTEVIAGQSMGSISLEETRSSVLKKLGKPTKSFMWETLPLRQDVWLNQKTKSRLAVLYIAKLDQVAQIETTSPNFVTTEGLSVQTPAETINEWASKKTRSGFLKSKGVGKPDYFLMTYDSDRGLAFLMKMSSKPPRQWTSEKMMVFISGSAICLWSRSAYQEVSRDEFFGKLKQVQKR